MSTKEIKFLFKVRSRMLLVKHNYKENYRRNGIIEEKSLLCPLCKKHSDNQENLVNC